MKPIPPISFVLLGTLLPGPKHGYDILQFIARHLSDIWHVSNSQLYTLLKRLERDRYITAQVEIQDTRPSKRVFHLSDAGEKAFLEWLHSPVTHARDFRMEFVTKLFFFHEFLIEGGGRLIETQIKFLKKKRNAVRSKMQSQETSFKRFVFDFKENRITNLILWLSDSGRPFFNPRVDKV